MTKRSKMSLTVFVAPPGDIRTFDESAEDIEFIKVVSDNYVRVQFTNGDIIDFTRFPFITHIIKNKENERT